MRPDPDGDSVPLPDAIEPGYVEANGIDIHYVRTGGGPDDDRPSVVVAHGIFDDARCRLPLVREFEAEYDVVAYDARGHGRTDAPESGYDIESRVADLVRLLDALDIDNPFLFGHSMCADTVAATAATHPDLPRAAVLVDPAAMLPRDPNQDMDVHAQITAWQAQDRDTPSRLGTPSYRTRRPAGSAWQNASPTPATASAPPSRVSRWTAGSTLPSTTRVSTLPHFY